MISGPDWFTGAAMAVEGMDGVTLVLHGQNGCRKPLLISERLNPRPDRKGGIPFSRVNASDLTGTSLVKLRDTVDRLDDTGAVVVMCSPGVSILGDDCRKAVSGQDRRTVLLEDIEGDPQEGFDKAVARIVSTMEPRRKVKGTVNLLGLSIMDKDWTAVKDEFTENLGAMGLKVVCCPGAGCTLEELERSVSAEFNIALVPDQCVETSKAYMDVFGIPTISTGHAPVGFDETYRLYREVAERTGKDISPMMKIINRCRRRAYLKTVACDRDMKGVSFSVDLHTSLKEPLVEWLEDSFAMVYDDRSPDIVFTNGYKASLHKGGRTRYIDAGFPSMKVDFVESPLLGLAGSLFVLDRLLGDR
ncbi:MAG: nitrogenase component 1 [archaeon]|nr:nitrogenase component 1 [archaeon]